MRSKAGAALSLLGKRILVAKPGLDGHDVGAKIVAMALRDAGADVIYTGLRKSPEYIAGVALDEGAHAVGLSVLSGSHLVLVAGVAEALRARAADDVVLFVGGTIPRADHQALVDLGVRDVFSADMPLTEVVERVAIALAEQPDRQP